MVYFWPGWSNVKEVTFNLYTQAEHSKTTFSIWMPSCFLINKRKHHTKESAATVIWSLLQYYNKHCYSTTMLVINIRLNSLHFKYDFHRFVRPYSFHARMQISCVQSEVKSTELQLTPWKLCMHTSVRAYVECWLSFKSLKKHSQCFPSILITCRLCSYKCMHQCWYLDLGYGQSVPLTGMWPHGMATFHGYFHIDLKTFSFSGYIV